MNTTVKSVVFWVAMIVLVALVWNFSSRFQRAESPVSFSEFIDWVDSGQVATRHDHRQRADRPDAGQGKIPDHVAVAVRRPRQPPAREEGHRPGEGADGVAVGRAAAVVGADPAADWFLDLLHAPGAERRQQGAVVRQEQGEAVVVRAEEGDVPRRRRRGRSEERAAGDHRVPQGTAEVPEARRPHSEGRAADGPAGNRQDLAGARGRRRSERAVLLDQRLRLRRDVRRRRRVARARPVRAGQEERALHHLHRRD